MQLQASKLISSSTRIGSYMYLVDRVTNKAAASGGERPIIHGVTSECGKPGIPIPATHTCSCTPGMRLLIAPSDLYVNGQ